MKKLTFITCLALLPLALQAQEDRYDQLTNPKLTSINKEAPRSTFTSYDSEENAIINDRTEPAAYPSTGNGSSTMWRTLPTVLPTS